MGIKYLTAVVESLARSLCVPKVPGSNLSNVA
jgi:hypothetical protein